MGMIEIVGIVGGTAVWAVGARLTYIYLDYQYPRQNDETLDQANQRRRPMGSRSVAQSKRDLIALFWPIMLPFGLVVVPAFKLLVMPFIFAEKQMCKLHKKAIEHAKRKPQQLSNGSPYRDNANENR